MSTTILKRQWVQGKKFQKGIFPLNQSTRSQQLVSVQKLNNVIQELTYGATKEAIEKTLASANKRWMKVFYKHSK